MEHILSLSYGKDSIACLGAIEKLGWPLERIIHAEIWATDTIPADLPPMVEFKKYADKIIYERCGIRVEHVCATIKEAEKTNKKTYEDCFYKKYGKKSKREGQIFGFPSLESNWCNSQLKTGVLKNIEKKGNIVYLGIASDEPKRFHNFDDTHISPLVEAGWTESDCRKWCEENDLLSPIYTTAARGGCWFCHNQGVDQLRQLRHNYPEYWELMLKWDKDSPVSFHADGHTVHDFDRRFEAEDLKLVPSDRKFRWKMLDEWSVLK